MPLGFLGGTARVGSQVFNAQAKAQERIEEKRIEEEEREQQRRMQALQMAVIELQLDQSRDRGPLELSRLRTGAARDREELERIRRGEPPTPGQPRPTPGELREETRARTLGQFDATAEALGDPELAGALRFREERPNAPPSGGEVRQTAQTVVRAFLQQDPTMDPDSIWESMQSEEWLEQQDPAVQLLLSGGRLNLTQIQAAHQQVGGFQLPADLQRQLDAHCGRAQEIDDSREEAFSSAMERVRANPQWSHLTEAAGRYFRNTCNPGLH